MNTQNTSVGTQKEIAELDLRDHGGCKVHVSVSDSIKVDLSAICAEYIKKKFIKI